MSFRQIAHYLIRVSIVLICFGVLYKIGGSLFVEGGVGEHNPALFGVAPDAFIRFASTLLLLAISFLLLAIAEAKSVATGGSENWQRIGESAPGGPVQGAGPDADDSEGSEG